MSVKHKIKSYSISEQKENKTYTTHIDSLNLESCLYATMMALLSHQCTYNISKPHRVSQKTIPFIKIREIVINNEIIDVKNLMKKRGQSLVESYQNQQFSLKTAQRRERSRRRMEMVNFLEDFLFLNGIDISVGSSSMYGIYGPISIECENVKMLSTKQITQIGKKVVEYLNQKLCNGNDLLIEKNELDQFISEYVLFVK